MIYADQNFWGSHFLEVDSNMAVDAGEFRRALESVGTFLKFLRFTASKKNA